MTFYNADLLAIRDGAFYGLVPSAIAAPVVMLLLRRLNSRQTVSEYVPEHQAKQGTPTMGGLIVLVGLVCGALAYYDWPIGLPAPWLTIILGFGAIGFLDDYVVPKFFKGKRGLGWVPKLLMQFAVAVPVSLLSGFNAPDTSFWAAFTIVAFSNAFNLSDGMDGLAGGIALIMSIALAAIGFFWQMPNFFIGQCLVLSGALIPFLWLNAHPAKVFMGDVGSLPIGATLGWLCLKLLNGPEHSSMVPADRIIPLIVLSLILLVELIPVPLQILSVKLRKKRLFPRTPIHHAFQAAGWPETRVVSLFVLVQIVLVLLAIKLAMTASNELWVIL